MLTAEQRQTLLALARMSVVERVRQSGGSSDGGEQQPGGSRGSGPEPRTSILTAPCLPDASGVFVTLKLHGELRGCLGTLKVRAGLGHEVIRCAAESASEDPRFSPVCCEELQNIRIEISVLGPLQQIDPTLPDAFAIGQHGLVVEHRHRRGLLLPQVAVEWNWSPHEFLGHTCLKAGLSRDAWRNGAIVYRFGAEVFGD